MNASLMAVSPIDGRYKNKVEGLSLYFSEYALIKYRVQVEIEYLIHLSQFLELEGFSEGSIEPLRAIYTNFTEADAEAVKKIESTTNHDVKAVEYFIKR